MAKKRYSQEFNEALRNEVRNYNKRLARAEQRGYRNLPQREKVRDIKTKYKNVNDIRRQMARLRKFSVKSSMTKVANQAGTRVYQWQNDFIKANLAGAKEYFQQEYARVSKRELRFPGERTYLDTVGSKLRLLEQDISTLSESQARSMYVTVKEFYDAPQRREAQYRGFLQEVEWVMDITGVSDESKDAFFKKFGDLTPSQFLWAYDNNDIIAKILSLYQKNIDGGDPYLTDPEHAENMINILLNEADLIVEDAKLNMD